jgi:hypothetical protein
MCLKISVHYMRVNYRFQSTHYNFDTVHSVQKFMQTNSVQFLAKNRQITPFTKFLWLYNFTESVIIKFLLWHVAMSDVTSNHIFHESYENPIISMVI